MCQVLGTEGSYGLNLHPLSTKTLESEYHSLLETSGKDCASGRGGETSGDSEN